MAHGNISDLALLMLFIGAIQTWISPGLLFSSPVSDEVKALIRFTGGLHLLLGLTFSAVKWNPINGKMGGFGGFCAIANAVVLGSRTGNIFFYVFAAVLFVGVVHIFAFPSNPLTPKSPTTKNNHGNASDLVALLMMAASVVAIFYPAFYFQDHGPITASWGSLTTELEALVSYCGGLTLTIALVLSGVKWNPINGKLAGIGCFVASALAVYFGSGSFYYFNAATILAGGVHIFAFPSNPLPAKTNEA